LLVAEKFSTQIGSSAQSAVRFAFLAELAGALFPTFPVFGLAFFELRAVLRFTFFAALVADRLAAFFGAALDFFFFFFKVLLLSRSRLDKKASNTTQTFKGPVLRKCNQLPM
jgi:hypothetical protein